ncbi:DUF2177 family protein [Lactococcus sp. dk322]|uniref:DUF2177 family protein n=1 Tax=Lactococcus sp. dk322 TaxID=2603290 RepID=UPI00210412EB|nr:DUF2177 family protein [Lactococcus sp. dk322]
MKTIINSAILGLVCYATYDLTNLSTLKGWPFYITVIDICWGTFLSALIGFLTHATTRLL